MPPDQKEQLFHAAMFRRGLHCTRIEIAEGEAPVSLGQRAKEIFDTAP